MPEIKIPFVSLYTPDKEALVDSIFTELKGEVSRSQFILSKKVSDFEEKFSALSGCKYAVGVNSGLDALILGLRALNIGPGDEVITPPNSFIASTAAIHLVGAKPVFVDVKEDFNLSPELVEKAITSKTRAIMPVHLTGNPCHMTELSTICKKFNLKMIEDAAQAIGASFENKLVGSFGDIGCFSLHPLKNLHIWGDGGMVTTNNEALYQNLKLQRNHGLIDRDAADFFSYNSRLDSLQAVVGMAFLELLPQITQSRLRNAELYNQRLKNISHNIALPIIKVDSAKPVFHVYQVRAQRRDELRGYLLECGIETKIHYPIPIHLQKAASSLHYKRGDFPVTEKLATEILSLPIRESLSPDDIHFICDKIELFYRD